jgi:hypothetical protein
MWGGKLKSKFIEQTHRQLLLYSATEMLPIKSNRV